MRRVGVTRRFPRKDSLRWGLGAAIKEGLERRALHPFLGRAPRRQQNSSYAVGSKSRGPVWGFPSAPLGR